MKTFVQDGNVLALTAPYDVLSGRGFLVGSIFAVAEYDALSGAAVEGRTEGVFDLVKVGSQAWAVGDIVYWDNANKRLTKVALGSVRVGVAVASVGAGAGETTGRIRIVPEGGGGKMVMGQSTTVTASDTIVTGLGTLTSVVVSFDSDPSDDPQFVSGSIGDQAGAPAAGSFLLKTWRNTGGTDPTPIAATTFARKVNWIAFGS
jgi:predicted RecA/RadA family phage recombinase